CIPGRRRRTGVQDGLLREPRIDRAFELGGPQDPKEGDRDTRSPVVVLLALSRGARYASTRLYHEVGVAISAVFASNKCSFQKAGRIQAWGNLPGRRLRASGVRRLCGLPRRGGVQY